MNLETSRHTCLVNSVRAHDYTVSHAVFVCFLQSVCKTGRVVIAHEAPLTTGFASEVSATLQVRIPCLFYCWLFNVKPSLAGRCLLMLYFYLISCTFNICYVANCLLRLFTCACCMLLFTHACYCIHVAWFMLCLKNNLHST